MKWVGYARGWKDAIKAAFRIALSEKVDPKDAYSLYGGSALPIGILFANSLLKDPVGEKMLTGPVEMTASALSDWGRLKSLAPGTLGREYVEALTGNYASDYDINLKDESDIRLKSDYGHQREGGWTIPEGERDEYIARQLMGEIRWQHDLMHVLLGYKPDISGEIGVTAFLIWHIGLPAPLLVTTVWVLVRTITQRNFRDFKVAYEAFFNGRKAVWLFPIEWESYLATPLDEVRKALRVSTPKNY